MKEKTVNLKPVEKENAPLKREVKILNEQWGVGLVELDGEIVLVNFGTNSSSFEQGLDGFFNSNEDKYIKIPEDVVETLNEEMNATASNRLAKNPNIDTYLNKIAEQTVEKYKEEIEKGTSVDKWAPAKRRLSQDD